MDYMASMHKMPIVRYSRPVNHTLALINVEHNEPHSLAKFRQAAHGYGSFFTLSIMDRYWVPDMTLEQGYALLVLSCCAVH
jgi:hypothetical protein